MFTSERTPGAPQPLSGIRIVDLTRLLPGPWATMLLGDLGADVVKVESPHTGGDPARHATPRYGSGSASESVYFCNTNRNKRSVVIDLKAPAGVAALHALVREADVVVESGRPGVADRLGVGYEALRRVRPDLVYCALSGYGQHGPLAQLAGHDLNIAGMSGLLQATSDERPAMPRMLMGDYAGGMMMVVGILTALLDRARHGRGAYVDVAMLDGLMSWATMQMIDAFAQRTAAAPASRVEGWGGNPRYGIYETRDGKYVTVSLLEKKFWDAFCELMGRPDLVNPHETEADRLTGHGERGAAYREFLEATFRRRDRDAWIAELHARGIPVCPVLTPDELVASTHAEARGHFLDVECATLGRTIPQMGFPFRMTMSDGSDAFALRRGPPPLGNANAALGIPPAARGDA